MENDSLLTEILRDKKYLTLLEDNADPVSLKVQFFYTMYLVLNKRQEGLEEMVRLYQQIAISTDEDLREESDAISEMVQDYGDKGFLPFLKDAIKKEQDNQIKETFIQWEEYIEQN